jgi:hypothetical protein
MSINVTPIPRLIDLAAPAFTLGTANAAGSAVTAVASDATLLAFDAVAVDAITFGQTGSVGTATVAPRRDHVHAMEAETPTVAASEAEMEAASSTTVFDTPGRTQYHPGVAKAHVNIIASGGIDGSNYNTASVTDTGTGDRTWVFDTDFSAADNQGEACTLNRTAAAGSVISNTRAAGSVQILVFDASNSAADISSFQAAYGAQ